MMRSNGIKRPNALKGNDIIGLMKLFPAFFTRDGPTDGRSYRDARTHLKSKNGNEAFAI